MGQYILRCVGPQDPIDVFGAISYMGSHDPTSWGLAAPIHTKEANMSKKSLGGRPLTISVPEAGKRYFGLCRNAAYDAAARGDLPVIRIGRLLRVPVRALERMLERASEPSA